MTPENPTASEPCDRCGREAAGHIAEEALCETCYHQESSCCGRFGDEGECLRGR